MLQKAKSHTTAGNHGWSVKQASYKCIKREMWQPVKPIVRWKKHPLLHTPLVILTFQKKARKKAKTWTPVFFVCKRSCSFASITFCSIHRELACLPLEAARYHHQAMFQTKLSPSPPALGEMVYSLFQWHSLWILCSGSVSFFNTIL